VFAGDGAALVVVGPGGEAGSIFIRYPDHKGDRFIFPTLIL
jgi:hypothetical protein